MTPLCNEQTLRGEEGRGGGGMGLLAFGRIREHTDLFLCNDVYSPSQAFASALPFPSHRFQISLSPTPLPLFLRPW